MDALKSSHNAFLQCARSILLEAIMASCAGDNTGYATGDSRCILYMYVNVTGGTNYPRRFDALPAQHDCLAKLVSIIIKATVSTEHTGNCVKHAPCLHPQIQSLPPGFSPAQRFCAVCSNPQQLVRYAASQHTGTS